MLFAKLITNRKCLFVFFPALCIWSIWLGALGVDTALQAVISKWEVTLTMVFGSIVAGATSLGGGVVAFPVFTKILHIPPTEAKLFALAIQTVGMGTASMVIVLKGIRVEWRIILWSFLGASLGIVTSLNLLRGISLGSEVKLAFSLMLACFGFILWWINRCEREAHSSLIFWGKYEKTIILVVSFIGGIVSGIFGSGADFLVFALMVLLFRISEKISTPTSVVVMALNAAVGFFLQYFIFQDFPPVVIEYWLASIPVVVIGAPLGAIICAYLDRKIIVKLLLFMIGIEVLSTLMLVSINFQTIGYVLTSLVLFAGISLWMSNNTRYTFSEKSIV